MSKKNDTRDDQMTVGVFFKNTGHHIASWLHPKAQPDAGINLQHSIDCAQKCEKAGLVFIFFADSVAVRDTPRELLSQVSQFTAYFEPITLLSALSMATERLGLVCTATTSFSEPYNIARMYASLDHISKGRIGWNVVTSGLGDVEAQNYGLTTHYEHDERYDRAQEFVECVLGLLDSWEDDAFLYDREASRFFDPEKLHELNHDGKFFKSRGPLNVPRSPQGHPVIFQAGSSNAGRESAARFAEGVFTGYLTPESSADHYKDVKSRMKKYGRTPDQMRILPGCTIFCGTTEAEAKEKEEYLASLINPDVGVQYIATMTGIDLEGCSPDDELPDRESVRASEGTRDNIIAQARQEKMTIRQLYMRLAGSHGKMTMRGTPSQIADQMQDWFSNYSCDGFIFQPSYMPGDLDDIVELVVPELQNRGLFAEESNGTTLREHLGLERPANRYAAAT